MASQFHSLASFNIGSNQLSKLSSFTHFNLASTLTSVNLEFNNFTWLSDLSSLTELTSLRNLLLKGNSIIHASPLDEAAPVFPPSLQHVDVSYNNIKEWSFVDNLPSQFPGLISLRIAHNPVFDQQDVTDQTAASTEETHMFTIARVGSLKSLNFSPIKANDRANAEMFYLSRIAKQLATVPETAEGTILKQHPRYDELCNIHGAPDVIRRDEINPSFLEARLITVAFLHGRVTKKTRIPKSYDVYTVKSLVGKLFALPPLKVKLVWETGEWDPVGGFDEKEGESSDEEDEAVDGVTDEAGADNQANNPGRWVKREVELKDGPRQLGVLC